MNFLCPDIHFFFGGGSCFLFFLQSLTKKKTGFTNKFIITHSFRLYGLKVILASGNDDTQSYVSTLSVSLQTV